MILLCRQVVNTIEHQDNRVKFSKFANILETIVRSHF